MPKVLAHKPAQNRTTRKARKAKPATHPSRKLVHSAKARPEKVTLFSEDMEAVSERLTAVFFEAKKRAIAENERLGLSSGATHTPKSH